MDGGVEVNVARTFLFVVFMGCCSREMVDGVHSTFCCTGVYFYEIAGEGVRRMVILM
jgi:hypothetical protein